MPTLSNLQLPPPKIWQDFETLCCDLWRSMWNDPNAMKHGRQGQPQHGVDVFGNPDQKAEWAGVQCKGKDNYTNKTLSEVELRKEVDKATSFTPKLSRYTVATTGPRDAAIQQAVRTLSDEHRNTGLFTVDVWSWEDIVETLEEHPGVVRKHYPDFAATDSLREGFDQVNRQQAKSTEEIKTHISSAFSEVERRVADFAIYNSPGDRQVQRHLLSFLAATLTTDDLLKGALIVASRFTATPEILVEQVFDFPVYESCDFEMWGPHLAILEEMQSWGWLTFTKEEATGEESFEEGDEWDVRFRVTFTKIGQNVRQRIAEIYRERAEGDK